MNTQQASLKSWVFAYELSGCGFESRCCHLNIRYGACFEQGVPWHSSKLWVWIHSETRTWYDNNIQACKSVWARGKYYFFSLSHSISICHAIPYKSCCPDPFWEKGVLKDLTNCSEKYLSQRRHFNKVFQLRNFT